MKPHRHSIHPRARQAIVGLGLGLTLLAGAGAAWAAGKSQAKGAQGLPRYGVAVYSDLCIQRDSGDIGGQRITFHRFAENDSVIYEFTAGTLSWPVVASDVNLDGNNGLFDFTIQSVDNQEHTIAGRFARDGKSLTLVGAYCGGDAAMPMVLSKITDFGAKLKQCKACPPSKAVPEETPPEPTEPPAPREMPEA